MKDLKPNLLRTALLVLCTLLVTGGPGSAVAQGKPKPKSARVVGSALDDALQAMVKRAEKLKIKGVAVVAYAEGETISGWTSKMAVVGGSVATEPSGDNKGDNLLAIAYSKAAEMAATMKDSGSNVRAPRRGEFGWPGGLVIKVNSGYVIAAFSGGPSEDDVKCSRTGVEILSKRL